MLYKRLTETNTWKKCYVVELSRDEGVSMRSEHIFFIGPATNTKKAYVLYCTLITATATAAS